MCFVVPPNCRLSAHLKKEGKKERKRKKERKKEGRKKNKIVVVCLFVCLLQKSEEAIWWVLFRKIFFVRFLVDLSKFSLWCFSLLRSFGV